MTERRTEGTPYAGIANGACPEPEALAAFIDGGLDAEAQRAVAEHVSACETCYCVTRETGIAVAQLPEQQQKPQATLLRTSSHRSVAWLALAASVLVAVAGYLSWSRLLGSATDPRTALVRAVGQRRFFEARLSGGFQYGPRIAPMRGGAGSAGSPVGAPATSDWEILAAAAKLRKDIGASREPRARGALAAAHLVLGETDDAVRILEEATSGDAASPQLLSDLAAAYLTRATSEERADDFGRALESAAKAVALDPTLREALYNKAIALEAFALPNQAIEAWQAFLATERDPGWRDEAQRRLDALRKRPKVDFKQLERDIKQALDRGTDDELDTAVRANVGIARDIFELDLLPQLTAGEAKAQRLARSFARVTGDPYQQAILALAPTSKLEPRVQLWVKARAEYDKLRRAAAVPFLRDLIAAGTRDDVLTLWARQTLIGVRQATDLAGAFEDEEALISEIRRTPFRVLLGRALWQQGIILVALGRQDAALATLTEARRVLEAAGHSDYGPYMELMKAEAFTELGNEAMAAAALLEGMQGSSRLRERSRQVSVLLSAAQESTKRRLPRTALEILREAAPHIPEAGSESLPLDWRLDWAQANERVEPGTGLQELSNADSALELIRDTAIKKHMTYELAVARGELSTPGSSLASLGLVGDAIRAAEDRNARFRLPDLRLNEGSLLARAGDLANAIKSYRLGLVEFERPQLLEDDLLFSSAYRALSLYGALIDALVESGAPPAESLAVAERAYQLAYVGSAGLSRGALAATHLSDDEAIVAYFKTPNRLVAWVVRREDISVHRIEAPPVAANQGLMEVTRALVDPLVPRLESATRVVIVPHEGLHNMPFGDVSLSSGTRFGVRFALSLAPTVAWATKRNPFRPPKRLLAVGDPDSQGRLVRLAGAATESRLVASQFAESVVLTGRAASQAQWRQAVDRAEALHFATHATVNRRLPSLSRLILAGTASEDLVARDIPNLELGHVTLVMLAACESAWSSEGRAGTFSLVRPFMRAGAASVLGNVSAVGDFHLAREYAELARLIVEGATPSAALQALHRSGRSVEDIRLYAPVSM